MKRLISFLSISVLVSAISCSRDIFPIETRTKVQFSATNEYNTKTIIGEPGSVLWSPGDKVSIFVDCGNNGGNVFVSQNNEPEKTVVFSGYLDDSNGSTNLLTDHIIWGVYPFNNNNSCEGDFVVLDFPATQLAIADSFGEGCYPTIAKSTDTNLFFYAVGGGIEFSVNRPDIISLSISGNNGETLAGTIKSAFSTEGVPIIKEISNKQTEVVIRASEGSTLQPGAKYHVALLPTELNDGFTITIVTKDNEVGVLKSTHSQIIKRAVFGCIESIDARITDWEKRPLATFEYDYYNSNSAVLVENGYALLIDGEDKIERLLLAKYSFEDDTWDKEMLFSIKLDSVGRANVIYMESDVLSFYNYTDSTVSITHIKDGEYNTIENVSFDYDYARALPAPMTKSQSTESDKVIRNILKTISGTKASIDLAVNLCSNVKSIATLSSVLGYMGECTSGLLSVYLQEASILLTKEFYNSMGALFSIELMVIDWGRTITHNLTNMLIGDWDVTINSVMQVAYNMAKIVYTITGVSSNPQVPLSGYVSHRNVTTSSPYTSREISVKNGTFETYYQIADFGTHIVQVELYGKGGFYVKDSKSFKAENYLFGDWRCIWNTTPPNAKLLRMLLRPNYTMSQTYYYANKGETITYDGDKYSVSGNELVFYKTNGEVQHWNIDELTTYSLLISQSDGFSYYFSK